MIGTLSKMKTQLCDASPGDSNVNYWLPVANELLALNPLLGQSVKLRYTGNIFCSSCGKKTKKSFSQGVCYPCMQRLASCDMCILKPETCHYHQGTCREPQWGEQNCMIKHFVYLANTSGIKVGITRHSQVPTRWIDQGATQATPIFAVSTRLQSGLVETALGEFIADKTHWQAMLKGSNTPVDLKATAQQLIPKIQQRLADLQLKYGEDAVQSLDEPVTEIHYPVLNYPTKIKSFNLDKDPMVEGTLIGIKGQYLIFDTGVINIRKYTSYEIERL